VRNFDLDNNCNHDVAETSELENSVTNMTYKVPLILKDRSVKSENKKTERT